MLLFRGTIRKRKAKVKNGRAPAIPASSAARPRSEEHTSELQSQSNLVCRLLLEKKHLRVLGKEAIHRAFGTDVLPSVEQRGIDLLRGVIHEALLMQQREDRAALARTERTLRGAPRRRGPREIGRASCRERV